MAAAPTWPVCVKAVLIWRDDVILVRADDEAWELPGDRLERGESLEDCAERAVEQLGLKATAERLLDSRVSDLDDAKAPLMVTFGCSVDVPDPDALGDDYVEVRLVPVKEIGSLALSEVYAASITAWHRLLGR